MEIAGSPSLEELVIMREAAREVLHCQRVLAKTGDNIVGEILRETDVFYEWRHYPEGDVYDPGHHAQYYYHAHPAADRPPAEHGHFHTFLRACGMPEGIRPADDPDRAAPSENDDALSHLIAISMDRGGRPIRLFTTNRWVTGETWYAAPDVMRMLDRFAIDHARPSWPVNRWITAMIRLFRPEITILLRERDACIDRRRSSKPEVDVFEDRELAVTSEMTISIDEKVARIDEALRHPGVTTGYDPWPSPDGKPIVSG